MVGYNGNRWTPEQVALMEEMRAARTKWDEVAVAVGHPKTSCQQMMTQLRQQRKDTIRRAQAKATRQALREQADAAAARQASACAIAAQPAARPAPAPETRRSSSPDFTRSTSTARFQTHAELRARIEILGVTGGLLGDPEPGRSALDRMRAASANAPMEMPTLPRRSALDQIRSSNA